MTPNFKVSMSVLLSVIALLAVWLVMSTRAHAAEPVRTPPKGFMPLAVLYDDGGTVANVKGFEMEGSMSECIDTAKRLEKDIAESGALGRVLCVPILPAPVGAPAAVDGVGPKVAT